MPSLVLWPFLLRWAWPVLSRTASAFPLKTLTEVANEIARTGLPDGHIDIESDDEVKKLTNAKNGRA